jgi:hypothetical protein
VGWSRYGSVPLESEIGTIAGLLADEAIEQIRDQRRS